MIEYFRKHKYLIYIISILIIIIIILIFNKKPSGDCVVSEWSIWSNCDPVTGVQTQTRTIIQPKRNGCHSPPLTQTSSCKFLRIQSGNPIIQNNTVTMYNGSDIASVNLYSLYTYNILLQLKLPDNTDGLIKITDNSTFVYSLNAGNTITMTDGKYNGNYNYKPGDILKVSYNKLSMTANLIDSTTNNNIHTSIEQINYNNYQPLMLRIICTSPPTSSYTFPDIMFYPIP